VIEHVGDDQVGFAQLGDLGRAFELDCHDYESSTAA
jgi:hypothetical protein